MFDGSKKEKGRNWFCEFEVAGGQFPKKNELLVVKVPPKGVLRFTISEVNHLYD